MNELQQVLLIFAVVVIAGLYFLSRSRQAESSKDSKQDHQETTQNSQERVHTINTDEHVYADPVHEQASDALNNLGTPHIPISETTEKRITHKNQDSSTTVQQPQTVVNDEKGLTEEELFNRNQGVLSFGEEFDLPNDNKPETVEEPAPQQAEKPVVAASPEKDSEQQTEKKAGKHHVLIVDDPGMTGEMDERDAPAEHIKPSFGIPDEEPVKTSVSATNKEPEVFVIMVMSTSPGQEFAMTDVNQALLGVGLTYSEQAIFVKKDNMGNDFIKVANMLEPGTFPLENLEEYATPGVAMILELPTTVRAPAAMHDMIMMARKVSQRLKGRLYNMERQLIKESDLQSMRDAALDYESEPL